MSCPMSRKSTRSNLLTLTRCIPIMLITLSLSNTCKGQGTSTLPARLRIIPPQSATEGRFPYMCSIRKPGSGAHACGGIVVDRNWIMTAAHCLDPEGPGSAGMSPVVYCNIYERQDQDESKRFFSSQCYRHHLWDSQINYENDIALCRLDRSVPEDVDIPRLVNFGHESTQNDLFDVLGWGETGPNSGPAKVLQIGSGLELIPRATCNTTGNWVTIIKDSMICVSHRSKDTCEGDSGGPLLIRNDPMSTTIPEDPALDLIVGVTSFGVIGCTTVAPGVYTRISCYRPWIDCLVKETGQECTIHRPCADDSSPSTGNSPLCSGVPTSATFNMADALERVKKAIVSDESETVKTILCDGLSPDAVFGANKNSLLLRAAQFDAIESAKVLLQHGSQIEYKNSFGQAALSRAAGYGSDRVAQLLVDNGADIESKGDEGWTPLSYAASFYYPKVAQVLLMKGANIESKTIDGLTPLHLTAARDAVEVAQLLVARGANIEVKSNLGDTPLILAAYFGASDCMQLLLDNKAMVDAANNNGGTALFWAAASGRVTIVGVLLDNGASKAIADNEGKTPFDVICDPDHVDKPCSDEDVTTLRVLLEL